jgi:hypothetical protein
MTDDLTDAVRRLKELQADVERLKAGDDQRGVPRLLFSQSETAVARDRQTVINADLSETETAVANDQQTDLRFQGRTRAGYQSRARYGTATYATEERLERFETRRNVSLDTERELVAADVGARNSVGVEIRATSPVDIVILVEQSGTGPLTAPALTDRLRVSEGVRVPDADTVRVFLTNTGPGVADVLLGTTR